MKANEACQMPRRRLRRQAVCVSADGLL